MDDDGEPNEPRSSGPYQGAVAVLRAVARTGVLEDGGARVLSRLASVAGKSTDPGMQRLIARIHDLLRAGNAGSARLSWLARKCLSPDAGPGAQAKPPPPDDPLVELTPSAVAMAVGGSEVDRYSGPDVPEGYRILQKAVSRATRRYGGIVAAIVVNAHGELVAASGPIDELESPHALVGGEDAALRLLAGDTVVVARGKVTTRMRLSGRKLLVLIVAKSSAKVGPMRAVVEVASLSPPMDFPDFTDQSLRWLLGGGA